MQCGAVVIQAAHLRLLTHRMMVVDFKPVGMTAQATHIKDVYEDITSYPAQALQA